MKRRAFLGSCAAVVRRGDAPVRSPTPRPTRRRGSTRARASSTSTASRSGREACARNELRLPLSVRVDAVLPAEAAAHGRADATLTREDGSSYAWNGGVGPGARGRRVLGDLRAQARLSDARGLVHPLPEGPLGDVRRRGHPLLRRPQRLRSCARRARRVGPGAAAARRDRARARCRSTTSSLRSAPWAPSSSTRSSASTTSGSSSSTARARRSGRSAIARSCAS